MFFNEKLIKICGEKKFIVMVGGRAIGWARTRTPPSSFFCDGKVTALVWLDPWPATLCQKKVFVCLLTRQKMFADGVTMLCKLLVPSRQRWIIPNAAVPKSQIIAIIYHSYYSTTTTNFCLLVRPPTRHQRTKQRKARAASVLSLSLSEFT